MPQTIDMEAIRKLSVEQRLKLIQDIWETLGEGEFALTEDQMAEIRRRDRELDDNPEMAVSHDDMLARLQSLKFGSRKWD